LGSSAIGASTLAGSVAPRAAAVHASTAIFPMTYGYRRVDLPVAAAIEPVAVGVARADRDWCQTGGAGELGVRREALGAGDLADELGRRQQPEARLGGSSGASSAPPKGVARCRVAV
jgi:hypothetical protein